MAKGKQKRVKPHLLEEIEKHEGDNFTEQLMNWKNSGDRMSTEEIENQVDRAIDSFQKKIDILAEQKSDKVSTAEDEVDYTYNGDNNSISYDDMENLLVEKLEKLEINSKGEIVVK